MGDEMKTSTGGIHPGKPVIWPSNVKRPNVQSTPEESAGSTKATGKTDKPEGGRPERAGEGASSKPAITPEEAKQAKIAAKIIERGQKTRQQYSKADISELLKSQDIPDNELNQKLAVLMLRHDVPVTKLNMAKLATMMGADATQSMQEASIILLLKGVDSPVAAKILSRFLSENPQLASQLLSLKGNISDLLASLSMGKEVMSSKLLVQLSGVLAQFLNEIEAVPGNYKFSGKGTMGRAELSGDLRALKALMEGLPKENMPDTAEGQMIDANISSTSSRLDQMVQGLTSQAMLSKQSTNGDINYVYYQIPNAMAKPATTVDLVIKRSDSEGGKKIDPEDTEIIMSFDTLNMGRIMVKLSVKGKNVAFIFNTQNDAIKSLIADNTKTLAVALKDKDYSATQVQVKVNPSMCAIKPFLVDFLGVKDLMAVDLEA